VSNKNSLYHHVSDVSHFLFPKFDENNIELIKKSDRQMIHLTRDYLYLDKVHSPNGLSLIYS